MFRMIRRAPWIALGAAGVYYLDGTNGAARRAEAAEWTRALIERGRARWATTPVPDGGTGDVPAPLVASATDEQVRARAGGPQVQAPEATAGIPSPASDAMAKSILEPLRT